MAKRYHIALCVSAFAGGGAEARLADLANEYARAGHRVDFITLRKGPDYYPLHEAVRPVRFNALFPLHALCKLTAYLRREKPDMFTSVLVAPNILALWARRLARVKTAVVIKEANIPSVSVALRTSMAERVLVTLLMRVFYRWADKVVAPSQGARQDVIDFARLQPEKVAAIYNPIITPRLTEAMRQASEHAWLGQGTPYRVIVTAARLRREKALDILLRGFALLYAGDANVRLIILGDGEQRAALEVLTRQLNIADVVDFAGFKTNPYAYFYHADVFALSSITESFSNVIAEALACGCPVAATDCPYGPAEILAGTGCRLAAMNDPQALADAMHGLLHEPPPRAVLRARAADFSATAAASAYLQAAGLASASKAGYNTAIPPDRNRENG